MADHIIHLAVKARIKPGLDPRMCVLEIAIRYPAMAKAVGLGEQGHFRPGNESGVGGQDGSGNEQ
jgi:hypothetical protein